MSVQSDDTARHKKTGGNPSSVRLNITFAHQSRLFVFWQELGPRGRGVQRGARPRVHSPSNQREQTRCLYPAASLQLEGGGRATRELETDTSKHAAERQAGPYVALCTTKRDNGGYSRHTEPSQGCERCTTSNGAGAAPPPLGVVPVRTGGADRRGTFLPLRVPDGTPFVTEGDVPRTGAHLRQPQAEVRQEQSRVREVSALPGRQ